MDNNFGHLEKVLKFLFDYLYGKYTSYDFQSHEELKNCEINRTNSLKIVTIKQHNAYIQLFKLFKLSITLSKLLVTIIGVVTPLSPNS